jgi:DedD protein
MAGNGKRGGGDRVLESRHLVGLFLGVVLLCGVFFTLGYVMGRTQYGGAVHAAETGTKSSQPVPTTSPRVTNKPNAAPATPAPDPPDWDKGDPVTPPAKHADPPATALKPAGKAVEKPSKPVEVAAAKNVKAKEPPRFQPPVIGKNSIVLQVAATKQQRDALDMADVLQKKKFPSFVANSPADNFFHVQVGPYADLASAEKAQHALEQLGFKSIIKH